MEATHSRHSFPDSVTLNCVAFSDGSTLRLYVSTCETFGRALSRAGRGINEVESVSLPDCSDLSYEPDYAIASR